jgi:hypothetical protein
LNDHEGRRSSRRSNERRSGGRSRSTLRPRFEGLEDRRLLTGNVDGLAVPPVVDAGSDPAALRNDLPVVADTPLVASGTTLRAVEEMAFSGPVATFADTDPSGTAGDFSAAIDWGDGTTSAGNVVADGRGGFVVTGIHTYGQVGTFPVSVTIQDVGGNVASAQGQAAVAGADSGRPGVPGGTSSGGTGPVGGTPGAPSSPWIVRMGQIQSFFTRLESVVQQRLAVAAAHRPSRMPNANFLIGMLRQLEFAAANHDSSSSHRLPRVPRPLPFGHVRLPSSALAHAPALRSQVLSR